VYSFPEFFGERCQDKLRIVVAGSHGKTTTTSMLMHVFREKGLVFDFLVGAAVEGFERNVRLTNAPVCVIEGDEYLSSPLDLRPKFMHYDPDIAIVTGIAWDHMNVFPTWEQYVDAFRQFISGMRNDTLLIWYARDEILKQLVAEHGGHLRTVSYTEYQAPSGSHADVHTDLQIFGRHNLQNMAAAVLVCQEMNIPKEDFARHIARFKGASMRLQLIASEDGMLAYRDFAHAPSKVAATVSAVREKHPDAFLVAFFELHTYSSLNGHFIPLYKNTCGEADHVLCFYSPKTLEIKKMPFLSPGEIIEAFGHHSIEVATSPGILEERIRHFTTMPEDTVLLFMSSGRFGSIDLAAILEHPASA